MPSLTCPRKFIVLFFTSKPPVFQPPLEIHSYSEICVRQASVKPPVACIAKMKFEFEVRNVAISSSSPESLRISSPLSQPDCSESSVFCGCLKRLCGLTNLSVLTRTVPQGKGCSCLQTDTIACLSGFVGKGSAKLLYSISKKLSMEAAYLLGLVEPYRSSSCPMRSSRRLATPINAVKHRRGSCFPRMLYSFLRFVSPPPEARNSRASCSLLFKFSNSSSGQ